MATPRFVLASTRFAFTWLAVLALGACSKKSEDAPVAPGATNKAAVAAAPQWVEAAPKLAAVNAKVDIGTLRRVDDAVEAAMDWPMVPTTIAAYQQNYPTLTIPEGSRSVVRERVRCTESGPVSYVVESKIVGPDGAVIKEFPIDAERERAKVAGQARAGSSFGADPRSLVCWAAARKCAGEAFSWPPPQNDAPQGESDEAKKKRADYNSKFVSTCPL